MPRKRLIWQFYPSFLLITLVAVGLFSGAAVFMAQHQHETDLTKSLHAQASLLADTISLSGGISDVSMVRAACKKAGQSLITRFTVILPNGTVIGDSEADPRAMENHGTRPEISQAFTTSKPALATRYSTTVRKRMLYYCIPVQASRGINSFAVRTAYPLATVIQRDRMLALQVAGAGITVLLLAALLSLHITRRVTRPLVAMRNAAQRFASGDLNHRMPIPQYEEMASLAETMNDMAKQVADRIETIARERNQRDAVFASMCEGVLAIGTDQRILHINDTCCQMLGTTKAAAKGRTLQETIRNVRLQTFAQEAIAAQEDQVTRTDITLESPSYRLLQARGTTLLNADHDRIGALLVLNDVTHVKRLEAMRTDFVANVSHELKTPITSIKGFIETLRDGAAEDPIARSRFLDIIARQANHLDAIINDLLTLSRIEHDSNDLRLEQSDTPLRPILIDAIDICTPKAQAKEMHLELECENTISCPLNAHLFEQAVINLIDNAIKYSPDKTTVAIRCEQADDQVLVKVSDNGPGIQESHIDRLFERFYRIDKGRSRMLGGTGLGLAIVKHICIVHNGHVSVSSKPGSGSTFTIAVPAAKQSG